MTRPSEPLFSESIDGQLAPALRLGGANRVRAENTMVARPSAAWVFCDSAGSRTPAPVKGSDCRAILPHRESSTVGGLQRASTVTPSGLSPFWACCSGASAGCSVGDARPRCSRREHARLACDPRRRALGVDLGSRASRRPIGASSRRSRGPRPPRPVDNHQKARHSEHEERRPSIGGDPCCRFAKDEGRSSLGDERCVNLWERVPSLAPLHAGQELLEPQELATWCER